MLMNYVEDEHVFRRLPSAIVSALTMDRTLRNLFVEGRTDRLFIKWLLGDQKTCQIYEIETVNLAVATGGNRARGVHLANILRSELLSDDDAVERVRVFVDADFDHLDGVKPVLPLTFTDGRSLESYFLRLSCFHKMFRLAIMNEKIDDEAVFDATVDVCTILAAIREVDRRRSLELPFQSQDLRVFVEIDETGRPSVRLRDMLSNLFQRVGLQSSGVQKVLESVDEVVKVLQSSDSVSVVHGHDLECVLGEVLQKMDYHRSYTSELMRCTFERQDVSGYPALMDIVAFATG